MGPHVPWKPGLRGPSIERVCDPLPNVARLQRGPMMPGGTPLRSLDEDELLARILPVFPAGDGLLVPPGDDAAVLVSSERIIATTDTVVLGRDWLDAWSSGADIGHKVVAQNLADVAAMGGRPTGILVTLVADPDLSLEWVLDHVGGLAQACAAAGVAVLGGDLSAARPGVVLAVHGSLGLADAGLRLLRADAVERHPVAVARQRRPEPPLAAGPEAAAAGATAMLDLSDGLLRDGGRIARASHVVIDLDPQALAADVDALSEALGAEPALDCVLAGGEEHSLLATFPRE